VIVLETETVYLQNRYCMGRGSVILSHAAESVPQAGSRMTAWSLASTTLQTSKTAWDGGSPNEAS